MLVSATGVALLCGAGSAEADKKPPTFLMECVGGGSMTQSVSTKHNGDTFYAVSFDRARGARKANAVAAGQCAYWDRALLTSEPTDLVFESKYNPVFSCNGSGPRNCIMRGGDTMGTELDRAMRDKKFFQVWVPKGELKDPPQRGKAVFYVQRVAVTK
jgi:hypothetical protein